MATDRKERIKSQAACVSSWCDASSDSLVLVKNASESPVYAVVVSLVALQGTQLPPNGEEASEEEGVQKIFDVLPPLSVEAVQFSNVWHGMSTHPAVEVAFRDASGICWVRRKNGRLKKIRKDPLEHFGYDKPRSYSSFDHVPSSH